MPRQIGVCSWSMQVQSIPELVSLTRQLGISQVQIACGDPHHADWVEGEAMPAAAIASGLTLGGAMLGFPGEDYTTPKTIERTGGFGDPATRAERLERFRWALRRTRELGLSDLMLHAGFIPEAGDSGRASFLATLAKIAELAGEYGITVAFETGQESSKLLLRTLQELNSPNLGVNFDPANMLLYDKDDPIEAVELLAGHIKSVHLKDAHRPTTPGEWGQEVPLGQGSVGIPNFLATLDRVGYRGPLFVEREVGTQAERLRDIAAGVELARGC